MDKEDSWEETLLRTVARAQFNGGGVSPPKRGFASRPEATSECHCGGKGADPVGQAE